MFRLWKLAHFANGFAPLMDAIDAGGAGGDADPNGQGDGSQPADGEADLDEGSQHASGDPAAAAAGDDDEDDDEDDDLGGDELPTRERWNKVTAKLKKQNRRVKKLQPLAVRHRELKDQGLSLDDLLVKARNYDALQETIRGNKKLNRAIYGGDAEDEPTGRQTHTPPAEDPAFDESTLPFDPNASEANRYFANMAKHNHELNLTVKKLAERLNQVDGRDSQRVEREERGQWKGAIDAASVHIKDDGVRDLFKDAMAGAYRDRQTHGLSPQRLVDHYLKRLKVNPQEAARAGAAAAAAGKPAGAGTTARAATQQRIAEGNRTLPRTVAPTGTPAPARTGRERLADVNKRVRNLAGSAR